MSLHRPPVFLVVSRFILLLSSHNDSFIFFTLLIPSFLSIPCLRLLRPFFLLLLNFSFRSSSQIFAMHQVFLEEDVSVGSSVRRSGPLGTLSLRRKQGTSYGRYLHCYEPLPSPSPPSLSHLSISSLIRSS